MQLDSFARMALVLAAALGFGCSPATESAPPRPDIGTLGNALSERDELERTYLLTSYVRAMGPEDLPAALAQIEQHRVGISADEVRLFMLAWTRFDGPGAFAAARDWPTRWKKTRRSLTTAGAAYPLPDSISQTSLGPPVGHFWSSWVSGETPSRVGPKNDGQSEVTARADSGLGGEWKRRPAALPVMPGSSAVALGTTIVEAATQAIPQQ